MLSDTEVTEIKRLIAAGHSASSAARRVGCSKTTAALIARGFEPGWKRRAKDEGPKRVQKPVVNPGRSKRNVPLEVGDCVVLHTNRSGRGELQKTYAGRIATIEGALATVNCDDGISRKWNVSLCEYTPSAAEIRERAATERATWTEQRWRTYDPEPYEIPETECYADLD